MHFSYVDRGLYSSQIARFMKYLSRDNIKIILYEEFRNEPLKIMSDSYGFLGVDSTFIPDSLGTGFHETKVPRSLWLIRCLKMDRTPEKRILKLIMPSAELRNKLWQYFVSVNERDNDGKYVLNPDTERRLRMHYRESNQALEEIVGYPLLWPKE